MAISWSSILSIFTWLDPSIINYVYPVLGLTVALQGATAVAYAKRLVPKKEVIENNLTIQSDKKEVLDNNEKKYTPKQKAILHLKNLLNKLFELKNQNVEYESKRPKTFDRKRRIE